MGEDPRAVKRRTERSAASTSSLLSLARRSPQQRTLVNHNYVVSAVLLLVGHQYERQGLRVHHETTPSLPPVVGQTNALQQVVLNLVTNAAQAMPDGGDVTVTTSVEDSTVRPVVADTVAGIAAEHLQHIFEPFFTTKPS